MFFHFIEEMSLPSDVLLTLAVPDTMEAHEDDDSNRGVCEQHDEESARATQLVILSMNCQKYSNYV